MHSEVQKAYLRALGLKRTLHSKAMKRCRKKQPSNREVLELIRHGDIRTFTPDGREWDMSRYTSLEPVGDFMAQAVRQRTSWYRIIYRFIKGWWDGLSAVYKVIIAVLTALTLLKQLID